ncbi:MAG: molecular chaperone TorD family protein [Chloroflexi bacterium]|nr:molecular chaperone TorD family protein [Chloroflexota bacterium]
MNKQSHIRSQLYAILAQCFCKPEITSAGENEADSLAQTLHQAAIALNEQALGKIADRLLDALEISQDEQQAGQTLEIEYNRLFVGPGRPQVAPYESVYRDPRGLMGTTMQTVAQRYAQAGLGISSDRHDLPDHVATELGFMAYLAMQEAESNKSEAKTWAEQEHAFLRDHLGTWLPHFCQQVQESSRHPFYTALAELTDTFVSLDMQQFVGGTSV